MPFEKGNKFNTNTSGLRPPWPKGVSGNPRGTAKFADKLESLEGSVRALEKGLQSLATDLKALATDVYTKPEAPPELPTELNDVDLANLTDEQLRTLALANEIAL